MAYLRKEIHTVSIISLVGSEAPASMVLSSLRNSWHTVFQSRIISSVELIQCSLPRTLVLPLSVGHENMNGSSNHVVYLIFFLTLSYIIPFVITRGTSGLGSGDSNWLLGGFVAELRRAATPDSTIDVSDVTG